MDTIAILEGAFPLYRHLTASLAGDYPLPPLLFGQSPAELLPHGPLALLVLSPDGAVTPEDDLPPCRLLLLPGEGAGLVTQVRASCAMSYGTSPKDSITFSGTGGAGLSLSIQRELITLGGGTVERQELILPTPAHFTPAFTLAWAGTLLIMGVSPEELPGLAGALR